MGEAAVAKEPSMEDILSSIRKIISDDAPAEAQSRPQLEQVAVSEPVAFTPPPAVEEVVEAPVVEPVQEMVKQEPVAAPEPAANTAPQSGKSLSELAAAIKAGSVSAPEPVVLPTSPEPTPEPEVILPEAEPEIVEAIAEVEEPMAQVEEITGPIATVDEPSSAAETSSEVSPTTMAGIAAAAGIGAAVVSSSGKPEEAAPEVASAEEQKEFKGALMSPSTSASASEAFERLKRSAMDDIEAKTESVLRPMLREWIDENLPKMVERLIREEIERVARGG